MGRSLPVALLFVICFVVIAVPSSWAYWVLDGVALCTQPGVQEYPMVIADGSGGAIFTWQDNRSGNRDIYAQRLNASGAVKWTADGVALCTATGNQSLPQIISDGAGGAIIVWADYRAANYDIYAQRVNSLGAVQWTTDGVALCTATGLQQYPMIASDGASGAIVTWYDYRSGNGDVYAQRIDASGNVLWTANGVAVCTATGGQDHPVIISDGVGGGIITWADGRSGASNSDIYMQRVNSSGTALWTANGVAVCTAAESQYSSQIAPDGAGGCIATWRDYRSLNYDIYAQRIDASGLVQWAPDGVAICTTTGSHNEAKIVSLGPAGAIIAWYDGRGADYDIYAQRVDLSGVVQWTVDGIAICSAAGNQSYARVVSDGSGGAVISWMDFRDGEYDIYGQRIDAAGSAEWLENGVAICLASGDQTSPEIAGDGSGGAFAVWEDGRMENDIYAHRGYGNGRFPWPRITSVQDVPSDQGGKLHIIWDTSSLDVLPYTDITHYSVWRRLSLVSSAASETGDESPWVSSVPADFKGPAMRMASNGYSWEWLANVPARYTDSYAYLAVSLYDSMGTDPGWQYFMVTAHTATQYIFYDSQVDSGYSVDNLSPVAPVALMAEQSYLPMGLQLVWDMNGESDLSHYAVYRGLSEDFLPEEGNRLGAPFEAEYFDDEWRWDSGYYYKISAVDVHGNESGFALLTSEDITGSETPKAPETGYLSQNYPNPFNPMTRIAFGISAPARVSLRVYDAAGRLVRVLVESDRAAGHYSEIWDGRDGAGRNVSSGIYFYRLDAGTCNETRKMVLLK